MKKYISILLVVFLTYQSGYSFSEQFISRADSLSQAINSLSHDDTLRLSALRELARIEQSTAKGLELATELRHEAERLKVDRYVVFGSYYSLIYHYNHQNTDSIAYFSNYLIPIAKKEKIWVVYFDAFKLRTNIHSHHEDFELAINDALKMYKKAKEVNYQDGIVAANMCLATAYIGSERWEEGLAALKEAYAIAQNTKNEMVSIEVLGVLISISLQMENYPDLYKYLCDFEATLDRYLASFPFHETIYSYYTFIEIYYSYYYTRINQPDKAFFHLTKAEKLLERNVFLIYKLIYQDALSEYYSSLRQYHNALAHLDTTILLLKNTMPKNYYEQLTKKAGLLVQMGEFEEALPVYQLAITGKDSLSQAISNKQLTQLQKIYDLNNFQVEKEKIKSERHKILLFFISTITFLGLLFLIRAIFVRRQLKKTENEMRKATEVVNEANKVKDKFLSNLSYNIRAPLNNVVGFSQLMSTDPDMDEEQRKEYGDIVKKNSEDLINLVNSVLDLSRLEAGMMKFNINKESVNELCMNAQYMAKSKNSELISISFDNKAEKEEIETDGARFTQVLFSTLAFPELIKEEKEVLVSVEKDIQANCIRLTISGSPLADLADPLLATQEITIQNEINRLFIEHFHGTYEVNPANLLHTIVFTHPIS